jgi:hypothetical protein
MVAICGILTIAIGALITGTQVEKFNQYCSEANATNWETGQTQEGFLVEPFVYFIAPNGTQLQRFFFSFFFFIFIPLVILSVLIFLSQIQQ